jgi:hypothetical protein
MKGARVLQKRANNSSSEKRFKWSYEKNDGKKKDK